MGKPASERRLSDTEAKAIVRNIRISPQKLNVVAESIRGLGAERALNDLYFSKKRIARDVHKCLQSAIANAENNHQLDIDNLVVAEASVGKGIVMKRWRSRARGRTGKILKPFSNLTIVVREREEIA